MTEYIIETQQLTKHYGQVQAVNQLDLHVPAGSVYGFLGPNGSGKTTTIRMLLGLAHPTGGALRLFGQTVEPGQLEPLRAIGALVETPSYYPHLTGRENLEIVAVLSAGRTQPAGSQTRRQTAQAVQDCLTFVGLDQDANRLAKHYSLGMLQRLGLAMALLGQPRLLILDEPTNGLDPAGIHEMRALIRRLPEETGATVFVSSHLLSEVELIATHVGILNQGRLVFEGNLAQLRTAYPDQVIVRTDRPDEAGRLLEQHGWHVAERRDHTLLLPVGENEEAETARINQHLVQHGLAVYALQRQQASLEDMFLSLTTRHTGAHA